MSVGHSNSIHSSELPPHVSHPPTYVKSHSRGGKLPQLHRATSEPCCGNTHKATIAGLLGLFEEMADTVRIVVCGDEGSFITIKYFPDHLLIIMGKSLRHRKVIADHLAGQGSVCHQQNTAGTSCNHDRGPRKRDHNYCRYFWYAIFTRSD